MFDYFLEAKEVGVVAGDGVDDEVFAFGPGVGAVFGVIVTDVEGHDAPGRRVGRVLSGGGEDKEKSGEKEERVERESAHG